MPNHSVKIVLLTLALMVYGCSAAIDHYRQAPMNTVLILQPIDPCFTQAADIGDTQIIPCEG